METETIPKVIPEIWKIRLDIIKRITTNNLNFLNLTVGGTGSGKSIRALNMVECISNDGYTDDLLVMTPKDFLDRINGKNGYKIRKGDALIWDEGGLALYNKDWFTQTAKALSKVFQSMRYRNFALFLTVPSSGFILKDVRSLIHQRMHCIGVDQDKNGGYARIYDSTFNPMYDKTYNKHRRRYIDDKLYTVEEYFIHSAKKSTVSAYESYKDDYLTDFYNKMGLDFENDEKKQAELRKEKMTLTDMIDNVKDSINNGETKFLRVLKNGNTKLDRSQILKTFGTGQNDATTIRQVLLKYYEDKGIYYS